MKFDRPYMQNLLKFSKQYKFGIQSSLIIAFGVLFMLFLGGFIINKLYHYARNSVISDKATTVVSKAAVDDLVKQAADDKYIHEVFNDKSALPLPKHHIPLQPYNSNTTTSVTSNINNLNTQRCAYNGQMYVPGDIVKTEKGWIRCTPTIVFLPNKPTVQQYGNPAWVNVQ